MGAWRKPVTIVVGLGALAVLAGCQERTPRLRADAQVLVAIDRDGSATITASSPKRTSRFTLDLTANERAKLSPEERLVWQRLERDIEASNPGQYRDPTVAARRVADALFPRGTVARVNRHGSSATVHLVHAVEGSTLRFDPDATLELAYINGLRKHADVFLDVCTPVTAGRWSDETIAHDQHWGCAAWWTFELPGSASNVATLHIGSYASPSDWPTSLLWAVALAMLATTVVTIIAARRHWKWRSGLAALSALLTIAAFTLIFRFHNLQTAASRTREVFGSPVDRTIAHAGTVGSQWAAALTVAGLCLTAAAIVGALRPPPTDTTADTGPSTGSAVGEPQAV